MPSRAPRTIGSSPIQGILFVDILQPRRRGESFEATSLPGHLIHLLISGSVRQQCNGREYVLRPGCAMWYHEDELVRGKVLQAPWRFYTVNFIAPNLPPPSFESRLFFDRKGLAPLFDSLYRAWNDARLPASVREFRTHAALLGILSGLTTASQHSVHMDPRARLWWELETRLRSGLAQPIGLKMMSQLTRRSQATIARSCLHAVGMPPLKRVKQIRMSLARGLVRSSDSTMTEIADRVGYARVHEFSRDYRKQFNTSPTQDRTHHRRGN